MRHLCGVNQVEIKLPKSGLLAFCFTMVYFALTLQQVSMKEEARAESQLGTVLEIVLNPTTSDMVSHPGSLKASGASPRFYGKFEEWQGLRSRAAQTVMGFPS